MFLPTFTVHQERTWYASLTTAILGCTSPFLLYVCNEQEEKACYITREDHSKKYLLEDILPPP